MNPAEQQALVNEARIVRVTNIFDFEFTHAWGGIPYTLPVGKPMVFPYTIGHHLAKHLAMQSLIRKSPIRDEKETDGRGKDRPLWSDESLRDLTALIVTDMYEEERKPVLSEAEAMREKIEELNRQFAEFKAEKKADAPNPAPVAQVVPQAPVEPPTTPPADAVITNPGDYKDKAEVIEALKKAGIPFDARATKVKLEELLKAPAPAATQ